MAHTLRVLLIEDSEDDAALVVRALARGGYEPLTRRVESASALRAALRDERWDLVVSDHSMPGFTSFEALAIVREQATDLPFIVVSGSIGEETAVATMRAGANDYLMKSHLARLVPAVERELREAQQRAERQKAEDALQRSEQQLRQAQKMEAIGRLAGGIAHDFNNLLTAIIGYSELLLSSFPEGNPYHHDVNEIKAAGDRAVALTRQLLTFSRRQVVEARIVDLNGVVTGIHQMLRRLIGEDIQVDMQLQPGVGPISADPDQLGQVLMNLAINARDAMPSGGRLTIETADVAVEAETIRTFESVPAGDYVMLAVSDNGVGMDEATRARLFEPFFTTKPPGVGTGLGLSTIYGIVKQSQGYIAVYSEPGRGTTFRIYLPRAAARVAAPEAAVAPSRNPTGVETILLAEDDHAIRELVVRVLQRAGYRVLEAPDGQTALSLAVAHGEPIPLLITDVVMPDMNGPQLAERLGSPVTRVLFLSGYSDRAVVHTGILKPGLDFLPKPFSPSALLRKVREVLDRSPA